jgi:putative spermidine/putrescine transport system ATP-binding protein
MSDRVDAHGSGRLLQIGTPREIYEQPASRAVAEFVGTLNLIDADLVDAAAGHIRLAGVPVTLDRASPGRAGERISLALRPETVTLGRGGGDIVLPGRIAEVHFLGPVIRVRVSVEGGGSIALDTFNQADRLPPLIGAPVDISMSHRDLLVLAA